MDKSSEYKKNTYKSVIVLVPYENQKAIKKLSSVESVSGYIKDLIRQDIVNSKIEKARAANK